MLHRPLKKVGGELPVEEGSCGSRDRNALPRVTRGIGPADVGDDHPEIRLASPTATVLCAGVRNQYTVSRARASNRLETVD